MPWLNNARKNMTQKELKYCKAQASHYWHNERNKINAHILSLLGNSRASEHLAEIVNDHQYLTTDESGKQWLLQECRVIMDPKCTVHNKLTPSTALTKHVMDKIIAVAGKSVAKAEKALAQFAKRATSAIAEKHGFGEHSEKPAKKMGKKRSIR